MTNDIRTRRLIVTMPDVSGDEADAVAAFIDEAVGAHLVPGVNASHALDDAPLHYVNVSVAGPSLVPVKVKLRDAAGGGYEHLSADEARKLAALLLRAADESDARQGECTEDPCYGHADDDARAL